jgi:hypothetical protein
MAIKVRKLVNVSPLNAHTYLLDRYLENRFLCRPVILSVPPYVVILELNSRLSGLLSYTTANSTTPGG